MVRSIRPVVFAVLVGSLTVHASSASAELTEADLLELRFDGFRLGMSRSEVDRLIASRTDIAEPRISGMDSFDCGYLAPVSENVEQSDDIALPSSVGFEAADGRRYEVGFGRRPDEDKVSRLSYRQKRNIAPWSTYLAELEARFGQADVVGRDSSGYDIALWCADDQDCRISDNGPRKRQLSVRLLAHSPTLSDPGGHLDFELHEGRDRSEQRRRFYEQLRDTDPQEADRLFRQCRSPADKFASDDEAKRHFITLMNMGPRAGTILWKPEEVPAPVLSALGLVLGRSFGPGVCFNSMDVFVELPECQSYSMVRFRWARRMDDLWLTSLELGGASLRREYSALRTDAAGNIRKVWWDKSLAGFNAWRANGAVPMIEQGER